jgi:hypothetical protein
MFDLGTSRSTGGGIETSRYGTSPSPAWTGDRLAGASQMRQNGPGRNGGAGASGKGAA